MIAIVKEWTVRTYLQVLASSCARDARLSSHVSAAIGLYGAGLALRRTALCAARRVLLSALLMVGLTLQPGASRLDAVCACVDLNRQPKQ